ncbi:DUF342 domain-containing protein [Priestia megaterium]|uniref:DUF342 domain-containing protein n=1 Tax=Priestia megaterium TaxID=1404 RepID=A0A6H1NWG9_PRIMG|nr:DUF342 domain-containing protein [Priestia megaterium]QIZ05629.1 DUF342 domain-containing protein [Priestia megaterium]
MHKNALDYHIELVELKKLIDSIEQTLEWVEAAYSHLPEDQPGSVPEVALAFSEGDLRKSYEKFIKLYDEITQELMNTPL